MRRLIIQSAALALLSSLHACRPTPKTCTVMLVDVSKSITTEGFESEFKIVDDLAERMHRGDHLTVIPITGDADVETRGHVLSIIAPINRQAYDADLTAFRENTRSDIIHLRNYFSTKPVTRTDILGALDIAEDEFKAGEGDAGASQSRQALYIFSDFIEDDGTFHFINIPKDGAADLASHLRIDHHFSLSNSTTVRLVAIQSRDAHLLHPGAGRWIRAFWSAYFAPSGVQWLPLGAATTNWEQ
jgi:hypothetical protein